MLPRRSMAVALLLLLAACRQRESGGDEGARVKQAVEKFIDFGMSNERYNLGQRETNAPTAKVRRRVVDNAMSPRLRLDLEIELPYDLAGRKLEEAMLENARRAIADTAFQAVRVRAWPGPLQRYGGTMGYAVVAVDGQGWDGERLGYREARVTLAEGVPRLTPLDYRVLCALETEAGALASQGKLKPPRLEREARRRVARSLGLQVEAVDNAVKKAERYYMKE